MSTFDFLIKDYELKINYLTGHFDRMWLRFNFMISIESALVGALGFAIGTDLQPIALAFVLIGLATSIFWSAIGLRDRMLVTRYRSFVESTGRQIAAVLDNAERSEGGAAEGNKLTLERAIQAGTDYRGSYKFVGDVRSVTGIREGFGVTLGPALVAMALVILWLLAIWVLVDPQVFQVLSSALSPSI